MANVTTVNRNFNGRVEVEIMQKIRGGYRKIYPLVEDGIKWETERRGSPGKLTFSFYDIGNENLNIQEGDKVTLRHYTASSSVAPPTIVFVGYVFTKKRAKDGKVDITAYDALRYFKNKDTYVGTNKTASEILKEITKNYNLTTGTIESTSYVISETAEDNQSLFDIVLNALDTTLISTRKMFILYVDQGNICLRDANKLKTDVIINDLVAENFDYTSSIDNETYNEIELYYDNDSTNKREYYHAYDANTMNMWGRLRLTEQIQNNANGQDRAV